MIVQKHRSLVLLLPITPGPAEGCCKDDTTCSGAKSASLYSWLNSANVPGPPICRQDYRHNLWIPSSLCTWAQKSNHILENAYWNKFDYGATWAHWNIECVSILQITFTEGYTSRKRKIALNTYASLVVSSECFACWGESCCGTCFAALTPVFEQSQAAI